MCVCVSVTGLTKKTKLFACFCVEMFDLSADISIPENIRKKTGFSDTNLLLCDQYKANFSTLFYFPCSHQIGCQLVSLLGIRLSGFSGPGLCHRGVIAWNLALWHEGVMILEGVFEKNKNKNKTFLSRLGVTLPFARVEVGRERVLKATWTPGHAV